MLWAGTVDRKNPNVLAHIVVTNEFTHPTNPSSHCPNVPNTKPLLFFRYAYQSRPSSSPPTRPTPPQWNSPKPGAQPPPTTPAPSHHDSQWQTSSARPSHCSTQYRSYPSTRACSSDGGNVAALPSRDPRCARRPLHGVERTVKCKKVNSGAGRKKRNGSQTFTDTKHELLIFPPKVTRACNGGRYVQRKGMFEVQSCRQGTLPVCPRSVPYDFEFPELRRGLENVKDDEMWKGLARGENGKDDNKDVPVQTIRGRQTSASK